MRRAYHRLLTAAKPVTLFWQTHRQNEVLRRQVTDVEDRFTEQATFTSAVIDHMAIGLIVVTEAAVVDRVNPAAEQLFGFAGEDLVGRSISQVLPGFATQSPEQVLAGHRLLAIGGTVEWEGRRRNGEVFPVDMTLYGFPTSAGRRFAVSVRDLSERQTLDRLKRDFVSMVSHELRTPLTSLHGSLRLLRAGALGAVPAEADMAVRIAERNTTRLLTLVDDILDCERLAAGERWTLAPLEVAAVIRRALESVQAYADQEGVAIRVEDVSGAVLGQNDRLVQVLVNLLANAIRFSPRGGSVMVTASELAQWVEITVADRGRGIPANHRELIFEPFHQVDASDARVRGGSGLGLTIARRIVERHGGVIGVESTEGHGSTFWFRIPSVPASRETHTFPAAARSAG